MLIAPLGAMLLSGCDVEPPEFSSIKVTDQHPEPRDQIVVRRVATPEENAMLVVLDEEEGAAIGVEPVGAGTKEYVVIQLDREPTVGANLTLKLVVDAGKEGVYEPDNDEVIKNPRSGEAVASTIEIIEVEPKLRISKQDVASFTTVTVAEVASPGPGWVVVHEDDDGAPGKVIGKILVGSGHSEGVAVPLERDIESGEVLFAMLHYDRGSIGEFDDADIPVVDAQGDPVMSQFNPAATINAYFGRTVEIIASVLFWSPSSLFADEDGKVPEWATFLSFPFIVVWLFFGAVFLTIRMGFINVRLFKHAINVVRGKFDDPEAEGEVSHFQALTSALSATVGLGNIAGVAIAVSLGGPGATFWMIIVGLFGMTAKFTECSLAQMYRRVHPDGKVTGGAMMYLSEGLKKRNMATLGKVLAVLFVILCVGGSFGGGNAFQINQSLNVLSSNVDFFAEHKYVYGLIMVGAVGVVIIGGIKRIASMAEKIVPTMCAVYILACLYILLSNASLVPDAFALIVKQAFAPRALYGGFIGVLVTGITRAAFSNEAGIGSAAIAHSAAKTKYAVREGIVALLEPFIDTVVVCTMTALVIVITGAYNVTDPAYTDLITSKQGAALTSAAMGSAISWFPWVLTIATVLFAYSTMISWSYYGERCWTWLFGEKSSLLYKILFLVFTFLGSIVTSTNVLDLSDLMILGMSFPNILGLYILHGEVKERLGAYMKRLKSGEMAEEAERAQAAAAKG